MHKLTHGYANKDPLATPRNVNGNWYNNYAQYVSDERMHRRQRTAWNQRRNALARTRSQLVPVVGNNNRSNQSDRRSSNHIVGMNAICIYSNVSSNTIKPSKAKTNQKKKIRPAPKTANEKSREPK